MKELNFKFGEHIRKLREELGISQEELGFRANMSQTYVGQIERGEKTPSLETIKKLADGFGVTLPFVVSDLDGEYEELGENVKVIQRVNAKMWIMNMQKLYDMDAMADMLNRYN